MDKETSFVHLNAQSGFTPGALGNLHEYASSAHIFEQPALGLADANHIEAWTKFEGHCERNQIKPLFGVTLYPYIDEDHRYRVSLLVEKDEGFHSIYQLVEENKKQKKQLRFEDIVTKSDGLIAIAPQPSYKILRDGFDQQKLFFEYTHFADENSRFQLVQDMYQAQDMNAQVVATNRVWRNSPRIYDQLLSLALYAQRTGKKLEIEDFRHVRNMAENQDIYKKIKAKVQPKNMMQNASAFHPNGWLKPSQMMRELGGSKGDFADEWNLACNNTLFIAKNCEPEQLPKATLPEYKVAPNKTIDSELYERTLQGLEKRFETITPEIRARTEYELTKIAERKQGSLFLIVHDITEFARNKIAYEAVGSVDDSLVAYALGISNVDPIAHNLPFERFLGPDGTKLPDIDVQMDGASRHVAYDFLFYHFPKHEIYPAHIATFPTYGMGGALDAVFGAFGYTQKQIKEIKGIIRNNPPKPSDQTILLEDKTEIPIHIIKAAESLKMRNINQGTVSKHPSKVIFLDKPVAESRYQIVKHVNEQPVVPIDKDDVKTRGEMEFDAVSSFRLTLLQRMLDVHNLKKTDIPHEDPEILQQLFHAETLGIPDIETPWLRYILYRYGQMKQWNDLSESDLHVAFALSRPGVGDSYRNIFYQQLQSGEPFSYDNESIDQILEESQGVAVFQEQIMRLVSAIGGFNEIEADAVRRQISKERDPTKLKETTNKFLQGALSQGVSAEKAKILVDQIMHFGKYGFVKGHAIALMSNIAYKQAYLKKLDPEKFMEEVKTLKKGHYYIRDHPEAYDYEIKRIAQLKQ